MTLFLVLGGIGLAVLVVALVVGDIADFSGHFDALGGEWFSTAGIAGFVSALGFGGAIVHALTHVTWLSWVVGVVLGLVVAYGAGWLSHKLRSSTSEPMRTSSLVGATGTVISTVPGSGYGEVRLLAGGHPLKLNARGLGLELPAGTRVWVSNVLSPTAVEVTPVDPLDAVAEPHELGQ